MTSVMEAYRKNRFLTLLLVSRHGCPHECIYAIMDWYNDLPQSKRSVVKSRLMSI